jgi:hypothetical protein
MNVIPIPTSCPIYPLPGDYADLTSEGRRQARVNACRQWLVRPATAEARGRSFAASVRFFDLYYLWPDESEDWDPLFYDDTPMPSPSFHDDLLMRWGGWPRNLNIAPRGSAKTGLIKKAILLRLITRPVYTIIYATSSNDNCIDVAQSLKSQFLHNSRLNDDWAPDFPRKRIVPKRGDAIFSGDFMQLNNNSWLRTLSAESKQRGRRPRRYVLDDPEYDEKQSTSMQIIRDYMERLLFKVVLPMLMRPGCGCDWLATFVSRRHYAWSAMETYVDEFGHRRAQDGRFDHWMRMIIKAAYEEENGELISCWPEMWPSTIKEKEADPALEETVSLEEIKVLIGSRNFSSEYMANPGSGEDQFFPALEKEKHGYWFEQPDNLLTSSPWKSKTYICWYSQLLKKPQKMHLDEFLREAFLMQTVDTSYTHGPDSDLKCTVFMAINADNDLFVLDLWSKRCMQTLLVDNVLQMADRWRCGHVLVEGITSGLTVYQDLTALVATRAREMVEVSWLPRIHKFNPGKTDKSAKISAALQRRFEYGQIKLPLWRRKERTWRNLFNQIEEFNPDAPDGGLAHDDELDTVSMHMFGLRGRMRRGEVKAPDNRTPIQRLKDGEQTHQGVNLGHCVDLSQVTLTDILEVAAARPKEAEEMTNPYEGSKA